MSEYKRIPRFGDGDSAQRHRDDQRTLSRRGRGAVSTHRAAKEVREFPRSAIQSTRGSQRRWSGDGAGESGEDSIPKLGGVKKEAVNFHSKMFQFHLRFPSSAISSPRRSDLETWKTRDAKNSCNQ